MKLKSMMKRFANLLAVFILSVNCISAQNLTRWVNPFIGTGAYSLEPCDGRCEDC